MIVSTNKSTPIAHSAAKTALPTRPLQRNILLYAHSQPPRHQLAKMKAPRVQAPESLYQKIFLVSEGDHLRPSS